MASENFGPFVAATMVESLTGDELVPVIVSQVTMQTTVDDILALASSGSVDTDNIVYPNTQVFGDSSGNLYYGDGQYFVDGGGVLYSPAGYPLADNQANVFIVGNLYDYGYSNGLLGQVLTAGGGSDCVLWANSGGPQGMLDNSGSSGTAGQVPTAQGDGTWLWQTPS